MKKIIAAMLSLTFALSFAGCGADKKQDEATSTTEAATTTGNADTTEEPYYTNETLIDSVTFDIDNDGKKEDIELHYGPTSGLFTIALTASVDGKIKYETFFSIDHCTPSLLSNEDKLELFCSGSHHKITLADDNFVIEDLDKLHGEYWGEKASDE